MDQISTYKHILNNSESTNSRHSQKLFGDTGIKESLMSHRYWWSSKWDDPAQLLLSANERPERNAIQFSL